MSNKHKIYIINFNTGSSDPQTLRECILDKKQFDYKPFIPMSDDGYNRLMEFLEQHSDFKSIDETELEVEEKILAAADKEKAEVEKHKEVAARNLYRRRAGDVPLEHKGKCEVYLNARSKSLHKENIGVNRRCIGLNDNYKCENVFIGFGFNACPDIYDPVTEKD